MGGMENQQQMGGMGMFGMNRFMRPISGAQNNQQMN